MSLTTQYDSFRGGATLEACSGLWRSEDMVQIQIHMQRESAHDAVLKLGQKGLVQFIDLNDSVSAFNRDFSGEVRRCDEMERKLRFLQEEIRKAGIEIVPEGVPRVGTAAADNNNDFDPTEVQSLERIIDRKEADIRELASQFESLVNELNRCREHQEVLSRDLLGEMDAFPQLATGGLNIVTGVIPRANVPHFEHLIFRVSRGNAVVRCDAIAEPFENPATGEEVKKSCFVVFFSSARMTDKVKKICEANGATLYEYTDNKEALKEVRATLKRRYNSIGGTGVQNAQVRKRTLLQVAREMPKWKEAVATERGVYSVMNLLAFAGPMVLAKGWCALVQLDRVKAALKEAQIECGAQVATVVEVLETKDTKPTYFNTNKVTGTFQGIVDSYGIARYKEANPGVFTVITFPYLFGIMYGDIGHGLILTIFAAFLISIESKLEGKKINEIFAMIFGGRYLLFAMGLFAVYVGVLYNDMFGISTELFESGYKWKPLPKTAEELQSPIVTPSYPPGDPKGDSTVRPKSIVAFGIDGSWAETENKLEFYNSVKMKCAVIIGIVQMLGGVFISLLNHIYFNNWKQVYFRFIPEAIFLSCTFGYMAVMIIIKWVSNWDGITNQAPSLLETMTNFFLQPGTVTVQLFPGQAHIQVLLLLIAFANVPILLGMIPYLEKKEHEEKVKAKALTKKAKPAGEMEEEGEGEDEEHFDFSDIMIHQIIHTIEYVLGCVSNTASYLRLWALSLAHAQLSDVFWNFAFMMTVGLDQGSGVMVYVGFAVWLSATLGVLLMMESLSAFLHSLRLHWVEFQTKFYYGDGYKFQPFDLGAILKKL